MLPSGAPARLPARRWWRPRPGVFATIVDWPVVARDLLGDEAREVIRRGPGRARRRGCGSGARRTLRALRLSRRETRGRRQNARDPCSLALSRDSRPRRAARGCDRRGSGRALRGRRARFVFARHRFESSLARSRSGSGADHITSRIGLGTVTLLMPGERHPAQDERRTLEDGRSMPCASPQAVTDPVGIVCAQALASVWLPTESTTPGPAFLLQAACRAARAPRDPSPRGAEDLEEVGLARPPGRRDDAVTEPGEDRDRDAPTPPAAPVTRISP